MKILLITHGKDTYPAGLADIYFYLLREGFDVDFVNTESYNLDTYKQIPDYVGITSMTKEYNNTVALSKYVKTRWPNCILVLGGRHFSSDTEPISEADHTVIGEGEYAFKDLIQGKTTDKVILGRNLSAEDYKSLPFPDKDFIIKNMPSTITAQRSRVLFTRGCPFKCVFCESETGRKPFISKNPDDCVRYIKDLVSWFGYEDIFVYDDVFAANKKWLKEFRDEWIKQKAKANIRCFVHGKLFDEETLDLLKQVNTKSVCLGAESGDDQVLKAINKKTTVEDYLRVHELTTKHHMTLECLWMLGNITETNDTMKRTVDLAKRIGHKHPAWFSYAIPFPGTLFWKEASKYGTIIEPDFRKWGNQTIVFLPHGVTIGDMKHWYNRSKGVINENIS